MKPTIVSQTETKTVIEVAGQRIELDVVDGQLYASAVSKTGGNARVAPKAFSGLGGESGTWSAAVLNFDKKTITTLANEIKKNKDNPFKELFGEDVGEVFESKEIGDEDFSFKPKINAKKIPKGFFYIDGKISAKKKSNETKSTKVEELSRISESRRTASIKADAALAGFYIDKFEYYSVGEALNGKNWYFGYTDPSGYEDEKEESKDFIIGNGVTYPGGFKKNTVGFTMMFGLGTAKAPAIPALSGIVIGVAMKITGNPKNPSSVNGVIFLGVFNKLKIK